MVSLSTFRAIINRAWPVKLDTGGGYKLLRQVVAWWRDLSTLFSVYFSLLPRSPVFLSQIQMTIEPLAKKDGCALQSSRCSDDVGNDYGGDASEELEGKGAWPVITVRALTMRLVRCETSIHAHCPKGATRPVIDKIRSSAMVFTRRILSLSRTVRIYDELALGVASAVGCARKVDAWDRYEGEYGNEVHAMMGDRFVTVKRIFLQLWSDRLLHCGLEEAT
ncbi:hypothetical protein F5887DRAFT_920512 [Amanita rubescens]|nr:hypothetical protein F5887DRAFT_920512 [Amanita rubescens]